jgi:hypothetical protein
MTGQELWSLLHWGPGGVALEDGTSLDVLDYAMMLGLFAQELSEPPPAPPSGVAPENRRRGRIVRKDQLLYSFALVPTVGVDALVRDWNPLIGQNESALVETAHGDPATLVGASWTTSPPSISAYAQAPSAPAWTTFEVMACVRVLAGSTQRSVLSLHRATGTTNYFNLAIDTSERVIAQMVVGGTTFTAGQNTVLSASAWHLVGASFDGTTLRAWRDASQESTTALPTGSLATAPNVTTIGALVYNGAVQAQYDSLLGRVLVFNRVLAASERASLYSYLKLTYPLP